MLRLLPVLVLGLWCAPAMAQRPLDALLPPVSPACISSPFGPRVLPGRPQAGTYHYGVDLPAPLGTPIRAAAAGTVIRIERSGPGGLQILVQHPGFVGVYSHFGSVSPSFAYGRKAVLAGEKLGVVGRTGLTYGPHLYFGMFVADRPVDPEPFLRLPPCASGRHVVAAGRERISDEGKILPSRDSTGLIAPSTNVASR